MAKLRLAYFDYGYRVKTLKGKKEGQEGYVTGVSADGKKIQINLDEKPYSGKHHIIESPSNLEIIAISNPYNIFSTENLEKDEKKRYKIIKGKLYGFSSFDVAKILLLGNDYQEILKEENKKYFPERDGSDWIKLAEKAREESIYEKRGKIKKYYDKIKTEIIYIFDILLNKPGKKEVSKYLQSINKRLDRVGKE